MRWAAQTYNSAQDVIQYQDRESGSMVLKGVHQVSRMGVGIPLNYTATVDVRDERIRFRYNVGGPAASASSVTRGPFPADVERMQDFFDTLTASATTALETEDDF